MDVQAIVHADSGFRILAPSAGILPHSMRMAGMIGGLGPESSIDYYRSIIAHFRAHRPDGGYPHLLINSLDVNKGIAMLDAGRPDDLADYLVAGFDVLARAGADFGFIAANTPHIVFDEVQRRSAIPLLSICAPPRTAPFEAWAMLPPAPCAVLRTPRASS